MLNHPTAISRGFRASVLMTISLCLVAALLGACSHPIAERPLAEQSALTARGRYLVNAVVACGNCHTTVDGDGNVLPNMELAGRERVFPDGTYFSNPNISPDIETGTGSWSEQDIMNVIRYGRRPDGRLVTSRMPVEIYRTISDYDLRAIAAYVKSVPAVKNFVHTPNSRLDTPPPPGGYGPVITVKDTPRSDRVAYGRYLAFVAHCVECHTPLDAHGQRDYVNRFAAGGWLIVNSKTGFPDNVSRNITPDRKDGIGSWSDEEITTAIRKGIRPNGVHLRWPMAFYYFQHMTDEDVADIVLYLRTVPPKRGFGEVEE